MSTNKNISLTEELVAEQKIVHNQGLMRTIYKFDNNKAISCINITEFYDDAFAKIAYEANKATPGMIKNIEFDGKTLKYEWADDFFEQKGKGESKEVLEQFLKDMGWEIIK